MLQCAMIFIWLAYQYAVDWIQKDPRLLHRRPSLTGQEEKSREAGYEASGPRYFDRFAIVVSF